MELIARKAYQGIRMGTFETLTMYSERYRAYKTTASATNPVGVKDKVQAWIFSTALTINSMQRSR
jgi:hypothetical protein